VAWKIDQPLNSVQRFKALTDSRIGETLTVVRVVRL